MKITKRTAKLVSDLESILGDNCYNGDSYNGWTDEYGAHFRYPVTYLGTDGKYHKEKYLSWEIDYKNVLSDYIKNYEKFLKKKRARHRRMIN